MNEAWPIGSVRLLSASTSVLRKAVDGLFCGPLCDSCYVIALHINFVLFINTFPVQCFKTRKSKEVFFSKKHSMAGQVKTHFKLIALLK